MCKAFISAIFFLFLACIGESLADNTKAGTYSEVGATCNGAIDVVCTGDYATCKGHAKCTGANATCEDNATCTKDGTLQTDGTYANAGMCSGNATCSGAGAYCSGNAVCSGAGAFCTETSTCSVNGTLQSDGSYTGTALCQDKAKCTGAGAYCTGQATCTQTAAGAYCDAMATCESTTAMCAGNALCTGKGSTCLSDYSAKLAIGKNATAQCTGYFTEGTHDEPNAMCGSGTDTKTGKATSATCTATTAMCTGNALCTGKGSTCLSDSSAKNPKAQCTGFFTEGTHDEANAMCASGTDPNTGKATSATCSGANAYCTDEATCTSDADNAYCDKNAMCQSSSATCNGKAVCSGGSKSLCLSLDSFKNSKSDCSGYFTDGKIHADGSNKTKGRTVTCASDDSDKSNLKWASCSGKLAFCMGDSDKVKCSGKGSICSGKTICEGSQSLCGGTATCTGNSTAAEQISLKGVMCSDSSTCTGKYAVCTDEATCKDPTSKCVPMPGGKPNQKPSFGGKCGGSQCAFGDKGCPGKQLEKNMDQLLQKAHLGQVVKIKNAAKKAIQARQAADKKNVDKIKKSLDNSPLGRAVQSAKPKHGPAPPRPVQPPKDIGKRIHMMREKRLDITKIRANIKKVKTNVTIKRDAAKKANAEKKKLEEAKEAKKKAAEVAAAAAKKRKEAEEVEKKAEEAKKNVSHPSGGDSRPSRPSRPSGGGHHGGGGHGL